MIRRGNTLGNIGKEYRRMIRRMGRGGMGRVGGADESGI